jgi:hypothetical protein
MTNATYSQGPWATYVDSAHDGWIADADGNLIACAVRNENMQANARLIAAAPDLLAALEWWQAQMRDDNCDDMGKLLDEMSAKAHAAIAKAKGN